MALKEVFTALDLIGKDAIDDFLFDYIANIMYQKTENIEKLKYSALFDIIEAV